MTIPLASCPAQRGESNGSGIMTSEPIVRTGFVALSKFAVANGMTAEVKEAFRARPHLVDSADGFVKMEVLSPMDQPDEIWLITYWRDEASYKVWHTSHMYRDSHRGIPKGLKLRPSETQIRFFEHVAS